MCSVEEGKSCRRVKRVASPSSLHTPDALRARIAAVRVGAGAAGGGQPHRDALAHRELPR